MIDRNSLPAGSSLEQVDATAWMGMYALNMMEMAMEIAQTDNSFEDLVTKFYEQFILISESLNEKLWNKEDDFFYDYLHQADGTGIALKVRSVVGLSVLFDCAIIKNELLEKLPDFKKRLQYVKDYGIKHQKDSPCEQISENGDMLVSLIHKERLMHILAIMFDEKEFLSPAGIRALSKFHEQHPFEIQLEETLHSITYLPAESDNRMFGGNSNWRGPVWMPLNYLFVHSLYQFYAFYGDSLKMAFPTGTDNLLNLKEIGDALAEKIISPFRSNTDGNRPVHGNANWFYNLPQNKDLILFYEYYQGDNASGLGASHQTGWSSLVAELISNHLP